MRDTRRTKPWVALIACLLLWVTGSAPAEEAVDWAEVKRTWHSLSPERQQELDRMALAMREPDFAKEAGDNCDNSSADPSPLPISFIGSTLPRSDSINIGVDCGSGQTPLVGTGIGPDEVTKVVTTEDCELSVVLTPEPNTDLALYVLSPECINPNGNCIALDDDGGPGTVENVTINAVAGVDYFVVVDGFAGSASSYSLAISEIGSTGCSLTVPVELQGFSVE